MMKKLAILPLPDVEDAFRDIAEMVVEALDVGKHV